MNIKKLIKEEIINVLKAINEAPISDPLLKSLRIQIPGEKFPELKTWWEYEPEDIMAYVYWHQGQLPPTGPKFEKEWQNIVKQLHRNYPIPASELDRVLPKMDLDDRTERAISVGAPGMGEAKDPYTPTYGTGDVVHDCPKHVQETISGKKGKVVAHSLNEIGEVNYVDVDFGTGKVYHDIPTKKLRILEGQTHEHAVKAEPSLNERPIIRSRVDYSTMDLRSNIDIKWTSPDDMENDLRQWLDAVHSASGPGLVREVGMTLKAIGIDLMKDASVAPGDVGKPVGAADKFQ